MSFVKKRKWDEIEDSDEEPSFGRQILPVANLPDDYDGIPQNGMEYLFTVRRDYRSLPHVTRVPNPFELPEPEVLPLPIGPHPALPCKEWCTSFETHFKYFRMNISQPTIHVRPPDDGARIPEKRERDSWWAFIQGQPETDWNPSKRTRVNTHSNRKQKLRAWSDNEFTTTSREGATPQETWQINDEGEVELALRTDPADLLPTPSGTPEMQLSAGQACIAPDSRCRPREPTPALMRQLDHRTSLHLLMYFTHWIDVHLQDPSSGLTRMNETHARWIFALLSRVDDYVTADNISLLRNLARGCLSLLKNMLSRPESGDEPAEASQSAVTPAMTERSCWMVIAAVAGFWGQRDLWMEAEAMLRAT